MRAYRRTTGLLLTITAMVVTSLPAVGAEPAAADEPLVMEGAPPISYSPGNPGWKAKKCPKVSGKGKRKDCLQASDGSVRVVFGKSKATPAAVREVIRAGWEGMHRYRALGFTAAAIGKKNPLIIAIEPGDEDPYYSWKSGVVYLAEGTVKKLAGSEAGSSLSARMELWHELFHWIQDEHYFMGLAATNGGDTWWMETTAEVATFLIEPAGAPRNAHLYGRSTYGSRNVSQLAPNQWPADEFYQHAQRLLASMYASDPTMTVEDFVQAVNKGTFIVYSTGWPQRFRAAINEYAEYLLTGSLPGFGVVAPIESGVWFGDFIGIVAEKNGKAGDGMRLLGNNDKPQIDRAAGTVKAVMQRDSVYALTVVSGSRYAAWEGTYPPAKPAKLTIEPGPPFMFRIDGGPIIEHDGGAELVIEPIIEGSDIGEVRIVAIAKDAGAAFRARIEASDVTPSGTARLVHTLFGLDPDEEGKTELVCPFDGSATLEIAGREYSITYEGENWHHLEGSRFACGGGEGAAWLSRGAYAESPLAFTPESDCDRDTFSFDGTTLSGTTYAHCSDSDVYTWEVMVDTLDPPERD